MQTSSTLFIDGISDDGGLKQTFQLQAMDVMTGQPQLTLQSDAAPEFWLTDLEPGSTFMLYLYAVNVKGLSQPVILPVSTLKEAAKRTVPPSTDPFSGGVVGAVAMGSAAAILLVASVVVVACLRCKTRQNSSAAAIISLAASTNETERRGPLEHYQHKKQDEAHSNGIDADAAKSHQSLSIRPSSESTCNQFILPVGHHGEEPSTTGFYHRPARMSAPATQVDNKRNCFKIPPEFVATMSDVPESRV